MQQESSHAYQILVYKPVPLYTSPVKVNVATASLATAGEGLLRQIREVKLAVMLQVRASKDRLFSPGMDEVLLFSESGSLSLILKIRC